MTSTRGTRKTEISIRGIVATINVMEPVKASNKFRQVHQVLVTQATNNNSLTGDNHALV